MFGNTLSIRHAPYLMEVDSYEEALMPCICSSPCPPLLRGDHRTIMDRPTPAHHQTDTPFLKSTRLQGLAQVVNRVGEEGQRRALLHQSAESWTRRHRV